MYCKNCGKEIADKAVICVNCGCTTTAQSEKSWIAALLLCFFLGCFGIHRFYVGKGGSGACMLLLTIIVIGIPISGLWALIDLIMIICGSFKTADGQDLVK